jgi:hypothetical protein
MMFLPALARELRRSSPGSRVSNEAVDAARVSARWKRARSTSPSACCCPTTRAWWASCCSTSTTWPDRQHWRPITPAGGQHSWAAQLSRRAGAGRTHRQPAGQRAARAGAAGLGASQLRAAAPLRRRAGAGARHRPGGHRAADVCRRGGGTHDLRVWRLPDGASYDVMMVWHQSVNGDPAQRWLREQVRHLFGNGRIGGQRTGGLATARTTDAGSLADPGVCPQSAAPLHWIKPFTPIRVPH